MAHEVELKFQLPGGTAGRALAETGEALGSVVQVNHVFDTADGDLRARGLTLRLREEEGRWTVTLKGPASRVGGARDREELEASISARTARAILEGKASPLEALRGSGPSAPLLSRTERLAEGGIRLHGAFRNRRTRVRAKVPGHGDVVLEIDRTELPGGRVDHEVELEVEPGDGEAAEASVARAESWLRGVLRDLGVDPRPASGKTGRFLRALEDA